MAYIHYEKYGIECWQIGIQLTITKSIVQCVYYSQMYKMLLHYFWDTVGTFWTSCYALKCLQ